MNTPQPVPASLNSEAVPSAPGSQMHSAYWSLRRELWEYRSVYLAPLAVAGLLVCGFLITTVHLRAKIGAAMLLDAARQHATIVRHYDVAAALIMGTAFIVSIFYCLDTLYGERRDRSILFWKSLPVSDLTTVLAKACVGIVVLPLVAFLVVALTQFVMLLITSVTLLGNSAAISMVWAQASFFHTMLMLLYHLVTIHMLWYAPLYGWLLLVSSWAPRAPFLWAFLPPLAIGSIEKIAFNSTYFVDMLRDRISGGGSAVAIARGFSMDAFSQLTPWRFMANPGLWIGLLVTAGFLFAAVRLRRYRSPM